MSKFAIRLKGIFALFVSLLSVSLYAADKPNIIVIMSDNQTSSLLGAYGNHDIKTPNIDRLAAEGMTFDQAFAGNGVCSPTRATFFTGLTPSQTGVHRALPGQLDIEGWSTIQEYRNLPQTLKDAGYTTAHVGKYHLGNHSKPQLGYDYWVTMTTGHTTKFYNMDVIEQDKKRTIKTHITDYWTEKALEFLNQQNDETPFFLMLSYNGPYMLPPTVNRVNASRHFEYYDANPPKMPQNPVHPYLMTWSLDYVPNVKKKKAVGVNAWNAINALNNKTAIVNVAAETTMVDDGVGAVMELLKARGLDENTLVIYLADQGASWGQHGIWGNSSWSIPGTAYDMNMKIPLIFRHPREIKEGVRSDLLINQFDIFPTLMAYAGLDDLEIENSAGRSFAAELKGENLIGWEDQAAYFEYVATRAVRTHKWKYIKRILNFPSELYNLESDPEERNNLIDNPAYAEQRTVLDEKLMGFFDTYSDPRFDLWRNGQSKGGALRRARGDRYAKFYPDFYEDYGNWIIPIRESSIPYSQ